jgi:U4/U6.U5 tri-snRNP-associated protein 1
VRNKRELNASLQGATLGDADADTDDTLKWIKLSKKREKELAKKRQAELESMDKVFQEEYTESGHTPRVCLPTTDICLSQRTWRV